jgi:hypothetical protein
MNSDDSQYRVIKVGGYVYRKPTKPRTQQLFEPNYSDYKKDLV